MDAGLKGRSHECSSIVAMHVLRARHSFYSSQQYLVEATDQIMCKLTEQSKTQQRAEFQATDQIMCKLTEQSKTQQRAEFCHPEMHVWQPGLTAEQFSSFQAGW